MSSKKIILSRGKHKDVKFETAGNSYNISEKPNHTSLYSSMPRGRKTLLKDSQNRSYSNLEQIAQKTILSRSRKPRNFIINFNNSHKGLWKRELLTKDSSLENKLYTDSSDFQPRYNMKSQNSFTNFHEKSLNTSFNNGFNPRIKKRISLKRKTELQEKIDQIEIEIAQIAYKDAEKSKSQFEHIANMLIDTFDEVKFIGKIKETPGIAFIDKIFKLHNKLSNSLHLEIKKLLSVLNSMKNTPITYKSHKSQEQPKITTYENLKKIDSQITILNSLTSQNPPKTPQELSNTPKKVLSTDVAHNLALIYAALNNPPSDQLLKLGPQVIYRSKFEDLKKTLKGQFESMQRQTTHALASKILIKASDADKANVLETAEVAIQTETMNKEERKEVWKVKFRRKDEQLDNAIKKLVIKDVELKQITATHVAMNKVIIDQKDKMEKLEETIQDLNRKLDILDTTALKEELSSEKTKILIKNQEITMMGRKIKDLKDQIAHLEDLLSQKPIIPKPSQPNPQHLQPELINLKVEKDSRKSQNNYRKFNWEEMNSYSLKKNEIYTKPQKIVLKDQTYQKIEAPAEEIKLNEDIKDVAYKATISSQTEGIEEVNLAEKKEFIKAEISSKLEKTVKFAATGAEENQQQVSQLKKRVNKSFIPNKTRDLSSLALRKEEKTFSKLPITHIKPKKKDRKLSSNFKVSKVPSVKSETSSEPLKIKSVQPQPHIQTHIPPTLALDEVKDLKITLSVSHSDSELIKRSEKYQRLFHKTGDLLDRDNICNSARSPAKPKCLLKNSLELEEIHEITPPGQGGLLKKQFVNLLGQELKF
ncbi:unnamed protein product [Moneuplotes crassus]|uniref:Uncharacterized protein n=1 Tax=Euplotes crassus TaxID=5936 RepID=A0AAD2D5P3_EUPCR|nr:unnamed protein product [Moneuplotes crassus]